MLRNKTKQTQPKNNDVLTVMTSLARRSCHIEGNAVVTELYMFEKSILRRKSASLTVHL